MKVEGTWAGPLEVVVDVVDEETRDDLEEVEEDCVVALDDEEEVEEDCVVELVLFPRFTAAYPPTAMIKIMTITITTTATRPIALPILERTVECIMMTQPHIVIKSFSRMWPQLSNLWIVA